MNRLILFGSKLALLCVSFVTITTSSFLRAQSIQVTENCDHIFGVIAAYRDCLETWQTGDVLIERRDSGDGRKVDMTSGYYSEGPDAMSVVVQKTEQIRFSFDFLQNRYRAVIRNEQEIMLFDSTDELAFEPTRNWSERAYVQSKSNGTRLLKSKGKLFQSSRDLTHEDLGQIGVPPLKWFGIGLVTGEWTDQRLNRQFDELTEPDFVDEIANVSRHVFRINAAKNHPIIRSQVDWDTKRMVPVRIAIYRKPNKKFPEEMAILVENCEWQNFGDLFAPLKGRGKKADWLEVDGHRFIVDYETEFDAHWFSFNEELPPEMFDTEQLRSVTTLNELLSEKPLESDSKKDPADSPSR